MGSRNFGVLLKERAELLQDLNKFCEVCLRWFYFGHFLLVHEEDVNVGRRKNHD